MLPGESLTFPVLFEFLVSVSGTVLTVLLALLYLRRVRLERPAIGTFNGRDIAVLFVFIVGLPLLYVVLPLTPLLVVLGITFVSALSMGLRPLMNPTVTWLSVGLLVGLNVWMARNLRGTVFGWQLFWLENSIVIMVAAVTVANLYVQGGMRVKHVAWFALILAVYDLIFTFKWPVTNALAQRFLGWPLDPAIGYRLGIFNASLGLGDLLVYSLFVIAVYKAYGRAAARTAMVITVFFGAVVPALAPLVFRVLIDARTDLLVPAQAAFGPAAFVCYRWLKRVHGPERTMAEFLTSADVSQPTPAHGRGMGAGLGELGATRPSVSATRS
jgi:hypothetical protein